MNTVSALEVRQRLGDILNNAFYRGISTTVERKGKPIARIVPITSDRTIPKKSMSAYVGLWANGFEASVMKKAVRTLRRASLRSVHSL